MARIRTIKPELFEDEALGECSRDARYLFVGLISHSDDHGRQRGNPRLILANVFPYDANITAADVESWLAELARARVIQVYESARQKFVQVVNWRKHQRVDKVKDSEIPVPPTLPDNPTATGDRSGGATIRSGGATEGNGRDKEGKATTSLVESVFAVWQERCNHQKAHLDPKRRRAISARLREGVTEDELLRAIDGAARAAFVSDAGVRFDDIELICRDRVKLDSFIKRVSAQPQQSEREVRRARNLAALGGAA